jgi:hypothetical protein
MALTGSEIFCARIASSGNTILDAKCLLKCGNGICLSVPSRSSYTTSPCGSPHFSDDKGYITLASEFLKVVWLFLAATESKKSGDVVGDMDPVELLAFYAFAGLCFGPVALIYTDADDTALLHTAFRPGSTLVLHCSLDDDKGCNAPEFDLSFYMHRDEKAP